MKEKHREDSSKKRLYIILWCSLRCVEDFDKILIMVSVLDQDIIMLLVFHNIETSFHYQIEIVSCFITKNRVG